MVLHVGTGRAHRASIQRPVDASTEALGDDRSALATISSSGSPLASGNSQCPIRYLRAAAGTQLVTAHVRGGRVFANGGRGVTLDREGGPCMRPLQSARPAGAPAVHRRGRALILLTVCLALFLALLDSTALSIALPLIARDLNTGMSGLQWTADG